jgi:hypothetical protein
MASQSKIEQKEKYWTHSATWYYKDIILKTTWYLQGNRHIGQCNRTQKSETYIYIHLQLIEIKIT